MEPEQLTALRNKLGLTRTEFGRLFGYAQPRSRIWELETGKMPISPKVAIIAGLLENQYSSNKTSKPVIEP